MAWQDRIAIAAFTSPSGVRLTFDYEDVSQNSTKKGAAFDFPDADGTFIQSLGSTGRRKPVTAIFSGADYDLQADAFEDALAENGVGTLEHPVYGVSQVVVFGDISRQDKLKTAANQATISVVFWDTIDLIFPTASISPTSDVLGSVDAFNATVTEKFGEVIDIGTALEKVSFADQIQIATNRVNTALKPVYSTGEKLQRSAEAVVDSINGSITALAGDPLTFAAQMLILMQLPSSAATTIEDRISAYSDLANNIFNNQSVAPPSNDEQPNNTFHTNELLTSSTVTGYGLSVINGDFQTRADAVGAADNLLEIVSNYTVWAENNYTALGEVDTGEIYQAALDVALSAAAFLVSKSFSLPIQKSFITDRARTILDLSAELYGSIDDERLNFLINTNKLVGQEILEVPQGREIIYFV